MPPRSASPRTAPLAARLRPELLEDFVGQREVVGPGSALARAIAEDRVGSAVFYGPPGSGKTTLARIIAGATGAAFEELSAVSASVADVRAVLARAKERLGAEGRRTILFLDEIHRFNKAQQDALLPAVESGLLTLIGATTENPYFEVNSALLSRTQVYELQPLDRGGGGGHRPARARTSLGAELSDELVELISAKAGGDGRAALNILELAWSTARIRGGGPGGPSCRGRGPAPAGRLRQGRGRALRLHLGVHQVDPRLRPRRGALLPRGHARRRRGSALHRPAPDRPCVRGHRHGRLAGAPRRDRGGARGRARGPARGSAQPRPRDDLPGHGPEVERGRQGDRSRTARRARARRDPPAEVAPGHALSRRQEARPRRGLRLPARTTRPATRSTTSRRSSAAAATTSRPDE